MNYNKVIIGGNLTRDVEVRYGKSGTAFGKFGMAINRKWRGEDGQTKEEVCFVDVDSFGKTAETLAKYCHKGSCILIEGRLKLDQWEDKNTGAKRSKLGVVCEVFQFAGGKGESQEAAPPAAPPATARSAPDAPPAASAPASDAPPAEEDDVPF